MFVSYGYALKRFVLVWNVNLYVAIWHTIFLFDMPKIAIYTGIGYEPKIIMKLVLCKGTKRIHPSAC